MLCIRFRSKSIWKWIYGNHSLHPNFFPKFIKENCIAGIGLLYRKLLLFRLEYICEGLDEDVAHVDFRLFMTAKVTERFPVPIIQNCIKVSLEEPKDIKLSLLRTFTPEKTTKLAYATSNDIAKRMSLAMSFFHALTNERTRFRNVGWNQPYIFPRRDLELAISYLRSYTEESEQAGALAELADFISSCIYGSCMEDALDAQTLGIILGRFCNKDVAMEPKTSLDSEDIYCVSAYETYEELMTYIQQLPEQSTRQILKIETPLYNQQNLKETESFLQKLMLSQNMRLQRGQVFSIQQIQEAVENILQTLPGTYFFLVILF